MAETTTSRLGIHRWSADSDTFSRVELDDSFAALEEYCAVDIQDSTDNRPVPGMRGRYFYDTVTGEVSRDTGTEWVSIGKYIKGATIASSLVDEVPLTISALSSQIANILEVTKNGSDLLVIDNNGNVVSPGSMSSGKLFVTSTADVVAATIQSTNATQTANLLEVKNDLGTNMLYVSATGSIGGPLYAITGGKMAVGSGSIDTISGLARSWGTPMVRLQSTKNGVAAFSDCLYLRHDDVNSDAVERVMGMLMRIGPEGTGDDRTTGVYMRSIAAYGNTPDLRLMVGGTDRVVVGTTVTTLSTALTVASTVNIGALSAAATTNGSCSTGVQGTSGISSYDRVASTGTKYIYVGGSHSTTAGDPGGGVVAASFTKSGTSGVIGTGRVNTDTLSATTLVQTSDATVTGTLTATGTNIANLTASTGTINGQLNVNTIVSTDGLVGAYTKTVFADEAARNAAIPSPTAGMRCYLINRGVDCQYTGSTWAYVGTIRAAIGSMPSTTVAGTRGYDPYTGIDYIHNGTYYCAVPSAQTVCVLHGSTGGTAFQNPNYWAAETRDPLNWHDAGSQYIIPTIPGTYEITSYATFLATNTGAHQTYWYWYKNDVGVKSTVNVSYGWEWFTHSSKPVIVDLNGTTDKLSGGIAKLYPTDAMTVQDIEVVVKYLGRS